MNIYFYKYLKYKKKYIDITGGGVFRKGQIVKYKYPLKLKGPNLFIVKNRTIKKNLM